MDEVKLEPLRNATNALGWSLEAYADSEGMTDKQIDTLRSGVIHNFETAYELAWKTLTHWMTVNMTPMLYAGMSKRELYRYAAQYGLIDDWALWMDYHNARNQTLHIYDENIANEVFGWAKRFPDDARALADRLEEKG